MSSVYIILLNWNGWKDTLECLESLKSTDYLNYRIVLVDNGSNNTSPQKIQEWIDKNSFKQYIHFFRLEHNFGFAAGNNVGIKYALQKNADYVLLLNNDTIVTEDFLSRLVETAKNNPKVGVVGCQIRHFPQKDKIWFNGGFINPLVGFCGHIRDNFIGERDVDFVTGCCMLIPSNVLKQTGDFDERFFLISEDTDLCWRIKNKGYKLVVNSQSVIYHKISQTLGGKYAPKTQYYWHRNRMLLFSKFFSPVQKLFFYPLQFLFFIPLGLILECLSGHFRSIPWIVRGYYDFLIKRFGQRSYL